MSLIILAKSLSQMTWKTGTALMVIDNKNSYSEKTCVNLLSKNANELFN